MTCNQLLRGSSQTLRKETMETTSRSIRQRKSYEIVLILYLNIIVIMPNIKLVAAHCKFTNLHCETFDKQALEFKKCYIKAVSRDYNYITIFINLKEVVKKVKVRVSLLKRANGWKPFLYDINVDGCQFIRNPARNPVANLFYQFLKEFSNINHACPYDHDVLIDKLTILNGTVKLPFPLGEYALDTQWVINNRMLLRVNGSCIYWKE